MIFGDNRPEGELVFINRRGLPNAGFRHVGLCRGQTTMSNTYSLNIWFCLRRQIRHGETRDKGGPNISISSSIVFIGGRGPCSRSQWPGPALVLATLTGEDKEEHGQDSQSMSMKK